MPEGPSTEIELSLPDLPPLAPPQLELPAVPQLPGAGAVTDVLPDALP